MELRLLGPPGTGKTTRLAQRIKTAHAKYGDAIMVCSFTRAAAHEIASRDIGLAKNQNVGTLHAICYRALGNPTIAESKVKEWNEYSPHLKLTSVSSTESGIDDPFNATGSDGETPDKTLAEAQRLRSLMRDRSLWPAHVAHFMARWDRWKEENEYRDFTDLIEVALRDVERAPGSPSVAFIDEAQDMTPLQVAVLRKWGTTMDHVLASGDDDQVLYTFAGATGSMLLDPKLPEKHVEILSQSWRVPRAVHRVAERWIKMSSIRNEKEYRPRDEDGEIAESRATVNDPIRLLDEINDAEKRSETTMILATCGYHLQSTIAMLRSEGVPFANPYRVTRGDWNPLAKRKGVSKMDALWSLLRPLDDFPPTWADWQVEWFSRDLRAELFVKGGKTKMKKAIDEAKPISVNDFFLPDHAEFLLAYCDGKKTEQEALDWYRSGLLASAAEKYTYTLTVAKKRGIDDETIKQPRVIVGTIHSVKGGEADRVILFPDLSLQGFREWNDARGRDAVIRQFYVGMTRAKRRLVIASPATRTNVGRLI